METEAKTPAMDRLERAIETLESALSARDKEHASGNAAQADAKVAKDSLAELSGRHDEFKATVAQCIGELDEIIATHGETR